MALFDRGATPAPIPESSPARPDRVAELTAFVTKALRSSFAAGRALAELRDLLGDRFDSHCKDRWSMTPRHARRLIAAADVFDTLKGTSQEPKSEAQTRPLVPLRNELRVAAWKLAVEHGDTTEAGVRAAVSELKPKRAKKPKTVIRPKPVSIKLDGVVVEIRATRKGVTIDAAMVLADALQAITEGRRQRVAA